MSRKWQKNRRNERKVSYVRESRENVVISAKIRTGAVQSLIPLTMDGAQVPTWITIWGIEWVVGAKVTTEARDCFMQRK